MQMKLNIFFYLALLMTVFSCCKGRVSEIPVLDVTKSYPSKNIILQDIADVDYIPLETKDGYLIASYLPIQYIDEEIFVTNNREEIMIFDRQTGKALHSFNRFGRGPGEYTGISSIAVDRNKKEMFTTTNTLSSNIHPINVYDLQGKHLRTLEFRNIGFPRFFHSYNNEYLFCYDSNIERTTPYKLLSKADTTFTYFPLMFSGREKMSVTQEIEGGSMTRGGGGNSILKTPDGYIFSEAGIDTMYYWNMYNEKLTPIMVRTPSFKSMNVPIGAFIDGQCSEYTFLSTIERKWDFETNEGFKTVKLIYDKKSSKFYEGSVMNSDYVDDKKVNISNPISVGQFAVSLETVQLVELYEKGKLRGKLEEIASKLAIDDNPVLMVVTFK
jgi:hypothetical protein